MRLKRLRLELGMELATDEVRMIRQFHHFHVSSVRRGSGEAKTGSDHRLFIFAVELVAMPVPLTNLERSVNTVRQSIGLNLARPCTEPHGSAQLFHAAQFAELVNHPVRRRRVKLTRI